MSEKPIKIFGQVGINTGGWYEQVPTDEELRIGTEDYPLARPLAVGETVESYTIKGTEADAIAILGQYSHEPHSGNLGVQVSYKQELHPLDTISVNVFRITITDSGTSADESKDYGSDGQGNTDYDDWTMQRHARNKEKKYMLVNEDAKDWPPFKLGDKILIQPADIWVSFAALQAGYRPDDTISYQGKLYKVQHINGKHYKGVSYGDIYQRFIDKVRVFVVVESRSWKVSKSALSKNHLYYNDNQKRVLNGHKIQYVQITAQGNRDGKITEDGEEPENKTYTITETITTKCLYTNQHIPHGYTLQDLTKDE